MRPRTYSSLLLFALAGILMWFFGNLYEGIVITPNLLTDSARKLNYWQGFFTVTNPIFFYLPIVPIALMAILFLYFKTSKEQVALKKHLASALIYLILPLAVGVFIITQINLKLFFGNTQAESEIYKLSILWNILNAVRIVLLIFPIRHLLRAYIVLKKQ